MRQPPILYIVIPCYSKEIVYGIRSSTDADHFFKRFAEETFYKLLNLMGAEVVLNHAAYRLISAKVLHAFADFQAANLYLRGLIPLVGFPSANVYYEPNERIAARLCGNTVAGWASITTAVCFIGGIQLICLGIIGGYIGKIYLEVKHRPRYIISERIGIFSEKEGSEELR